MGGSKPATAILRRPLVMNACAAKIQKELDPPDEEVATAGSTTYPFLQRSTTIARRIAPTGDSSGGYRLIGSVPWSDGDVEAGPSSDSLLADW
jgi:hypothetical protein